jgi:hypothetical protein
MKGLNCYFSATRSGISMALPMKIRLNITIYILSFIKELGAFSY